jgi:AbrB family looped-hinge helix DNA binding protein
MAIRIKVSSRFQIAVPSEVRKKLGIKRGDYLVVDVRGSSIVLLPEPGDYSQHLRSLHREVWDGQDPQQYVEREREAWQSSRQR